MQKRFAGKTAVITGGASGIGLAIARRFVQEGGKVIANDINAEGVAVALDNETKCHTGVGGKRRPNMPHGSGLRKAHYLHALVLEVGPKAVAVDKSARR